MGSYQSIAVYFAPELYKFLQREQKSLKIQFMSATSAQLMSMLRAGDVDFIVSIDPPKSKEFFHFHLFEDTYSLYRKTNSAHSNSDAQIFTLVAAKDRNGKTLEQYLKESGVWKRTISCGDFEAVKAMLEADAGYALLPERVALPLLKKNEVERVVRNFQLNLIGSHSVVFSCKAHRADDPSIKWIADQIRLMLR